MARPDSPESRFWRVSFQKYGPGSTLQSPSVPVSSSLRRSARYDRQRRPVGLLDMSRELPTQFDFNNSTENSFFSPPWLALSFRRRFKDPMRSTDCWHRTRL